MHIFSWVGIEPPNEKLLELVDNFYYMQDTGLMSPVTKGIPGDNTNNNNLYDFPGGKNKDKAFKALLKETEFQDKILIKTIFARL